MVMSLWPRFLAHPVAVLTCAASPQRIAAANGSIRSPASVDLHCLDIDRIDCTLARSAGVRSWKSGQANS